MKRHRLVFITIFLAICLLIPAATYAQPGGDRDRPSPGETGGSVGGPGMSGAALGSGRSQPGGNAPQGGGPQPGGNRPEGGNPQPGGNRPEGGNPQPGGNAPFGGNRPEGGNPQQPGGNAPFGGNAAPGGDLPQLPGREGGAPFGEGGPLSGFPPFSSAGDLLERFGERGIGNLPLTDLLPPNDGSMPPWLAQFERGGFGVRSQGGAAPGGDQIEGTPWRPGSASTDIPAAPAPIDDLDASTQTNAQTTLDEIRQQYEGQGQDGVEAAEDRADQAVDAAQDAYDQVWEDYYDAVDYTADVYYDTVSANTDYALQAYEEAVDYTAQTVDYYIAYAEQYASYCSLYPWDCYSYSYDASTNTYVYVGDVSATPVTTTEIGNVTTSSSVPVSSAPAPSAEAYEAIVVFANDQLGAVVEPLYAGVATGEVQMLISQLPAEMQAYFLNSLSVSGATYWGLLNGGVAGVAVGDCTAGDCTVNGENLTLHLSSGSSGAYAIRASAAMPATADEALALITQVYPRLEGLAFAQITDIDAGLAFTATTASMGVDPSSGQPVSTAKIVYAGVVGSNGQTLVYTVVAVGQGHVGALGN